MLLACFYTRGNSNELLDAIQLPPAAVVAPEHPTQSTAPALQSHAVAVANSVEAVHVYAQALAQSLSATNGASDFALVLFVETKRPSESRARRGRFVVLDVHGRYVRVALDRLRAERARRSHSAIVCHEQLNRRACAMARQRCDCCSQSRASACDPDAALQRHALPHRRCPESLVRRLCRQRLGHVRRRDDSQARAVPAAGARMRRSPVDNRTRSSCSYVDKCRRSSRSCTRAKPRT